MKVYDPENMSGRETYHMLNDLVVPRPIALVTTESRDGVLNCAPFSYYQGVCGSPPILSLSIARHRKGLKDTFRNILLDGEFVVHTPRKEYMDDVELAGKQFDPEVSEVDKIGFTPIESDKIQVQGLKEPPVRMECRLRDQQPIAAGKVTVVFGEVVNFFIDESILEGDSINFEALNPLARIGSDAYSSIDDVMLPSRTDDVQESTD